jgi:hypothetical protein
MSRAEHPLATLDQWIAAAYSDLGVYRARFDDSPSGEAARCCEAAEARLNELLQQRFAVTQGSRPASDAIAGGTWPMSLAG